MPVSEQLADAVQQKIQENVHDQREAAQEYDRVRGSIAIRQRCSDGICLCTQVSLACARSIAEHYSFHVAL